MCVLPVVAIQCGVKIASSHHSLWLSCIYLSWRASPPPPQDCISKILSNSQHVLGGTKKGRQTIEILGALNAMYSDLFMWLFIAGDYSWNRIGPFPYVTKCNCTVYLWHLLEYFWRPFTFPQICRYLCSIAVDPLWGHFVKNEAFLCL